ncbi:hypothetical protein ABPG74_019521 [Tetrahymena malaccensis]
MENIDQPQILKFDQIIDTFEEEFKGQIDKVNESLELLLKLINNIGTSPFEMKFRKIKSSNPTIKEKIFRFSLAGDLLIHIGFVKKIENSEEFYVLEDKNLMVLLPFIQHLRNRMELFQAKQISQEEYDRVYHIQKNKVNIVKKQDEDKKKGEELKMIFKNDRDDFRFIEKIDAKAQQLEKQRLVSPIQQISGDQQFIERVIQNSKPVVVHFYADWCPPCRLVNEFIENKLQQSNGWVFAKVNCDDHNNAGVKYNNSLEQIPTINFFYKGQIIQKCSFDNFDESKLIDTIHKAEQASQLVF